MKSDFGRKCSHSNTKNTVFGLSVLLMILLKKNSNKANQKREFLQKSSSKAE